MAKKEKQRTSSVRPKTGKELGWPENRKDVAALIAAATNNDTEALTTLAQLYDEATAVGSDGKPLVKRNRSNDNAFSEAGFKTLKYRPDFPERFSCIEDARVHCVDFFAWYNGEHYHSGIGLNTPNDVHYGVAQ